MAAIAMDTLAGLPLYMIEPVNLMLKGLAMGAANVIPGVSGGTIALVTGIYERLINAIKSFDFVALRLLLKFDLRGFWKHIDGAFLLPLAAGVAIGIVVLAKLLKYLLEYYQVLTMAFFFGLILLSVFYVGRTVRQWNFGALLALLAGTALAVGIAVLSPASENASFLYLFVCGIVAICSMILPGLSGSFVLIMMGNYALVLGAVSQFKLDILLPMALGCVIGLVAFSHVLAWIFKKFHDQTIALMTGFVLGSLAVIWPWKDTQTESIERVGKPAKEVVTGYDWFLPSLGDPQTWVALALVLAGAAAIWATERFSVVPEPG